MKGKKRKAPASWQVLHVANFRKSFGWLPSNQQSSRKIMRTDASKTLLNVIAQLTIVGEKSIRRNISTFSKFSSRGFSTEHWMTTIHPVVFKENKIEKKTRKQFFDFQRTSQGNPRENSKNREPGYSADSLYFETKMTVQR